MCRKVAVVGGGITAGLAAYMLASDNDITLFLPIQKTSSPIPELVPRQPFFRSVINSDVIEEIIVNSVVPSVCEVTTDIDSVRCSLNLCSNADYLVYDKGRLATWLIEAAGIRQPVHEDIARIADVTGFDWVLDCRGSKAVRRDPNYDHFELAQPLTACTYVIAGRPTSCSSQEMNFWNIAGMPDSREKTFFYVPVGEDGISVGCSHTPDLQVSTDDVIRAARQQGIEVRKDTIRYCGTEKPGRCAANSKQPEIIPLGEARESSCPLTEYGVLKALSHIIELQGGAAIPQKVIQRPVLSQVDPHIPLELLP